MRSGALIPELNEILADQDRWYREGTLAIIAADPRMQTEFCAVEQTIDEIFQARDGLLLAEERAPLNLALRGACARYRAILYRASQAIADGAPVPKANPLQHQAVRTALAVLGGELAA